MTYHLPVPGFLYAYLYAMPEVKELGDGGGGGGGGHVMVTGEGVG